MFGSKSSDFAEYIVLGGIANDSPFRPDTGGKGFYIFKERNSVICTKKYQQT